MPKVIVSDSSPIIHLSKIGELNLLKELFGEIIIPEAVYRESVTEGKGRKDADEIEDQEQEWIKVQEIRNTNLKRALNMSLDEGGSRSHSIVY